MAGMGYVKKKEKTKKNTFNFNTTPNLPLWVFFVVLVEKKPGHWKTLWYDFNLKSRKKDQGANEIQGNPFGCFQK